MSTNTWSKFNWDFNLRLKKIKKLKYRSEAKVRDVIQWSPIWPTYYAYVAAKFPGLTSTLVMPFSLSLPFLSFNVARIF